MTDCRPTAQISFGYPRVTTNFQCNNPWQSSCAAKRTGVGLSFSQQAQLRSGLGRHLCRYRDSESCVGHGKGSPNGPTSRKITEPIIKK